MGQVRPGVPGALERIINRLLQPDADNRLGHADVVVRTLAEVCGHDDCHGSASAGAASAAHLHKPRFVGRDVLLDQVIDTLGLRHGPGGRGAVTCTLALVEESAAAARPDWPWRSPGAPRRSAMRSP